MRNNSNSNGSSIDEIADVRRSHENLQNQLRLTLEEIDRLKRRIEASIEREKQYGQQVQEEQHLRQLNQLQMKGRTTTPTMMGGEDGSTDTVDIKKDEIERRIDDSLAIAPVGEYMQYIYNLYIYNGIF